MNQRKTLTLISLFLLCLVLSSTMFLNSAAENISLTVYISSEGNAENSGLTEAEPVSTLAEALAVANAETSSASAKVCFVLLSDLEIANDPYGKTPFPFQLTVRGKSGSETIHAKGTYVHHVGDTRYDDLHFAHSGTSNYAFLCGNGYDLVLGEGLSCTPNSRGYYLNLAGGVYGNTKTTFTSDSSLTVLSGQWETLYAGSYKDNQTGNATLYAENCKVHLNVGTCYTGDHVGTSHITLKNCEVAIKSTGMLQGGPTNAAGKLTGKLTLSVRDCSVRDFGVGFKCPITAPLSLSIRDCSFDAAYSVTATGESEIHLSATDGNTLDLSPAAEISATTFTGGGTLILGEKSLLTVDSVSGSTALSFGSSPATRAYIRASAATPDDAFTYNGTPSIKTRTENEEKIWTFSSAVTFKAPEDVTFTLYTGFTDGSKVQTIHRQIIENALYFLGHFLTFGNHILYARENLVYHRLCCIAQAVDRFAHLR